MHQPSAPKCICHLEGRRQLAMAIGRAVSERLISTLNGKLSTSITLTACSAPRSIIRSEAIGDRVIGDRVIGDICYRVIFNREITNHEIINCHDQRNLLNRSSLLNEQKD